MGSEIISGDNLLLNALKRIIRTDNPMVNTKYKIYLLINGSTRINPVHIVTVDILRDYNANVTDHMVVQASFSMTDIVTKIYPNRNKLEIVVTVGNFNGVTTTRYKAMVLTSLEGIEGTVLSNTSVDVLDKMPLRYIDIQCITPVFEALRTKPIYGVFANTNVGSLMGAVVSNALTEIKLSGFSAGDIGINITKPDNDTKFKQIIVPENTMVLDLPSYLQETDYGVYNGAVGTYIQVYNGKPYVFIYPLYGNTWFNKTTKKLIVYNSVTKRYDDVRQTYLVDGDTINIIATSNTKVLPIGNNNIKGSGYRAGTPYQLMNRNFTIDNGNITVNPKRTSVNEAHNINTDGTKLIRMIGNTSNLFPQRSRVLREACDLVQLQWNFCDMGLIYPGMPVCFVTEDASTGTIRKKIGVVQSTYEGYNEANKNTAGIINLMVTDI